MQKSCLNIVETLKNRRHSLSAFGLIAAQAVVKNWNDNFQNLLAIVAFHYIQRHHPFFISLLLWVGWMNFFRKCLLECYPMFWLCELFFKKNLSSATKSTTQVYHFSPKLITISCNMLICFNMLQYIDMLKKQISLVNITSNTVQSCSLRLLVFTFLEWTIFNRLIRLQKRSI